jgi:hypothetical protein
LGRIREGDLNVRVAGRERAGAYVDPLARGVVPAKNGVVD